MRIKRGETKRAKHKKVLKLTSGYRMSYHKLYRKAKEAVLHAGQYSYAHRRRRKSQIKTEWIKAISSALMPFNMSYSAFMGNLKKNNVSIDRKNIAEMAVTNPDHFKSLVESVK